MSRRTKLLLTLIFVVLLAVPLVYLVFTWHPRDPWRVHVVSFGFNRFNERVLEVELENTSSVPVHVYIASLRGIHSVGAYGYAERIFVPREASPRLTGTGVAGLYPVRIPPHQRLLFQISTPAREWEGVSPDALTMDCTWASETKHHAISGLYWLEQRAPLYVKPYVPIPAFGESTVPFEIEPSSLSSSANSNGGNGESISSARNP